MAKAERAPDWMQTAQLGKEHELLNRLVGEWNTTMRAWMGPDQPVMEGKGTSTIKALLGGRVFTEEFRGDFPGMPFEGFGTIGHDNYHQKYWQTWTDWMTSLYHAEGHASPDGKVISMTGHMDHPERGQTNVETKTIYNFLTPDHLLFEIYERGPGGTESKTFEVDYIRRK